MQSLKKIHAWAQMKVPLYTKYFGHMIKMAVTPIYGKNLLKIFSRTRWPVTLGLGM